MIMTENVVGVDVAKDWIDSYDLASGKSRRVEMTPAVVILEAALLFLFISVILPYTLAKSQIDPYFSLMIPLLLFSSLFVFYCRVMVSRGKR